MKRINNIWSGLTILSKMWWWREWTIFSKMWRQVLSSASWFARALLDCAMRWMQLHIMRDVHDNRIPFDLISHTSLWCLLRASDTWKLRFYAPLDERSITPPLANFQGYTHSNTDLKDPVVAHLNLRITDGHTFSFIAGSPRILNI